MKSRLKTVCCVGIIAIVTIVLVGCTCPQKRGRTVHYRTAPAVDNPAPKEASTASSSRRATGTPTLAPKNEELLAAPAHPALFQ